MHLSIPAVASGFEDFTKLANWCREHLVDGGLLALCAHNTAISDVDSAYSTSNDELRHRILQNALAIDLKILEPIAERPRLDTDTIVGGVLDSGFELLNTWDERFANSSGARIQLWRVPAVIGTLVDVQHAGNIDRLVPKEKDLESETMPMTVRYWVFQARAGGRAESKSHRG